MSLLFDPAEIACSLDDFSTLCTAIQTVGLDDDLNEDGQWTVFAPTDAAFSKLDDDLFNSILSDHGLLKDVLLFHAVANDVVYASDLECKNTIQMANGKNSRTVCRGASVYQKGAGNSRDDMPEIIESDIAACNGILHVVDEVMLPR